jgi:hypothetical protein
MCAFYSYIYFTFIVFLVYCQKKLILVGIFFIFFVVQFIRFYKHYTTHYIFLRQFITINAQLLIEATHEKKA